MDVYLFAVWFCVLRLSFYFNRSAELIHHQKKKKEKERKKERKKERVERKKERKKERT